MSVQPNEALREARARVAELEAEVEKLRKRSPRAKIEGVHVRTNGAGGWRLNVREPVYWVDVQPCGYGPDGGIGCEPEDVPLTADEMEVLASLLMLAARASRNDGVAL